jgi:diaminopimelate decarboxylase
VYELEEVRQAHAALRAALPGEAVLFYSLKANPHPAVAGELARLGCRAEISSPGELEAALEAGFDPSTCLYTGPAKSPGEVEHALRKEVGWFSVDSPDELAKVVGPAREGASTKTVLRINEDEPGPPGGLAMTGAASQFGADASWVLARSEVFRARAAGSLRGLHFFSATNVFEAGPLREAFARSVEVARRIAAALDVELELLDLGGGFGAPYARTGSNPDFTSLRAPLESMLEAGFPHWRGGSPTIAFESGRHLVATAGTLLTTVQDVKRSKGVRYVLADAGANHLGGMSGLRRLPFTTVTVTAVAPNASADDVELATVVGPLCTPVDVVAREVLLPALAPGDLLSVPNVGAYGLTASLVAFLSRPAPVEVVVDRGAVTNVSRLEIERSAIGR